MGYLCFKLDKIPDLTLNKYQSLADTGVDGVLTRHESFLRQWHGICTECNTSIHLLYTFIPSGNIGTRLAAFLILQGEDSDLKMTAPLLKCSPIADFFTLIPAELPDVRFKSGATLTKKERLAEIFNPLTDQDTQIHYVPAWVMNDGARMYDLFRILETVSIAYPTEQACAFRIDLYPASESQTTRAAFNPILKSLRGDNDIKLVRNADSIKSDSYARDISKEYDDWITAIETTPHFRVNMYGFADSLFGAKVILNAAGAEAISEGDFAIAPIKADEQGGLGVLSRMGRTPDTYCFFPNQASLNSWSTTYCLNEVIPFFRFPVLYDGETIELPKETAPARLEDGIYLGDDTNGYPVFFPLEDLPRHAFFTGMPGSGKTNTMLHIASQLRERKIPFLALEPAKKEYRAILGHKSMRDVFLFSPHLQSKFPLQMNPMEFPRGVRLSEHINSLLEVFQGSFILEGPTYKFLSSSIQRAYTDLGWDIEDIYTDDCELEFPSLQDVYDNLQAEIDNSSYDSELKGNVRAFLQVRLGSLMERDAGELFNTHISTIPPEDWIKISAIVELEVLAEQSKNFFVLLVCHYILETLRSAPNGGLDEKGNKMPVRHVVFIEEAHNIIASSTEQYGVDSVDPKISATAYIIKMLAEVRALREALIIADQLPTALAPEVTKNTGLKLVHRLTSQDDRSQIGMSISASQLQLERMAAFTIGRAFIYHEKTLKPFELQIAQWKTPDIDFDIADDEALFKLIQNSENSNKAISAAFTKWQEDNLLRLAKGVADIQQRYMELEGDDTLGITLCKSDAMILLSEINAVKKKCDRLRKLWAIKDNGMFSDQFDKTDGIIDGMMVSLKRMKFVE